MSAVSLLSTYSVQYQKEYLYGIRSMEYVER